MLDNLRAAGDLGAEDFKMVSAAPAAAGMAAAAAAAAALPAASAAIEERTREEVEEGSSSPSPSVRSVAVTPARPPNRPRPPQIVVEPSEEADVGDERRG